MHRGAWWATVYRVTKSRTRLSNFTLQGNQNNLIYILIYILHPSPSKMFFRTLSSSMQELIKVYTLHLVTVTV